jgi:hypothetical protein
MHARRISAALKGCAMHPFAYLTDSVSLLHSGLKRSATAVATGAAVASHEAPHHDIAALSQPVGLHRRYLWSRGAVCIPQQCAMPQLMGASI